MQYSLFLKDPKDISTELALQLKPCGPSMLCTCGK
uniref:Uncharacterized protein n=1 Tax=Anguilla anguilla TaxID=7936 RepID=A0A0E9RCI1_ANGAN